LRKREKEGKEIGGRTSSIPRRESVGRESRVNQGEVRSVENMVEVVEVVVD